MNVSDGEFSNLEFGLRLTSQAQSDLQNLNDPISDQIKDEILTLLENPKRGEKKGESLKNFRAFEPKVDRQESYRVGYALIRIDDEPWITIVQIGKRESFYERLKRRAESLEPEEFIL